ncbi:MAG TPA: poly-gamma-glutamate hydrolase family protein [Kribbellaceae bacterium]
MGTFETSVRKALSEQTDLIGHDEHCSVDGGRLAAIGRDLGHQVRIIRTGVDKAIYTVSQLRDEQLVRMGKAARERIGSGDEFTATVDSRVVADGLTDREAEDREEFVERLRDDGVQSALLVLAPHGGDIERHTDEQADRVAARLDGVTVWLCKGFAKEPRSAARFHITSGEIREESFPALGTVASRGFRYAVAFHGFARPAPTILVGGAGPGWLKHWVAAAVRRAVAGSAITVRVGRKGEPFNGDDPDNIVNRLTRSGKAGVQLEQTLDARSEHGLAIADAVAGVYRSVHRHRYLLIWWWSLRRLVGR